MTQPSPLHDEPELAGARELTVLIERAAGDVDVEAQGELMDVVYARMRAMAGRELRSGSSRTLQATALVHEAYVRIFGRGAQRFDNRDHFFAAVATVMRQITVDRARRIHAVKRGGGRQRVSFDALPDMMADASTSPDAAGTILDLDHALGQLAEDAPRQARTVELRFFAGLTVEQTATVLGVSPRTVELDWRAARARLRLEFESGVEASDGTDQSMEQAKRDR
ncbi:MAG: ECF-type sigma factor [Phycisphaerales bacterium]